jgi:hypothetical protein
MSLDLFPYFRGKMKKNLQLIWEIFLPYNFAYHWVLNGTYLLLLFFNPLLTKVNLGPSPYYESNKQINK